MIALGHVHFCSRHWLRGHESSFSQFDVAKGMKKTSIIIRLGSSLPQFILKQGLNYGVCEYSVVL